MVDAALIIDATLSETPTERPSCEDNTYASTPMIGIRASSMTGQVTKSIGTPVLALAGSGNRTAAATNTKESCTKILGLAMASSWQEIQHS